MSRIISYIAVLALLFASCNRPVARFNYSMEQEQVPAKVKFDNQSKKAESFTWDFGDGKSSTDSMPEHTYVNSGNYVVKLKAHKGKKSNIVEKSIKVEKSEKCLLHLSTKYGDMVIELYNDTPLHRDNFLKLTEEGFFNDLLFHRVINGFMIQGGDPDSRDAAPNQRLGMGGPGYTVPAEFNDAFVHVKGALSAARTGDAVNPEKKSSGSQFYIVQGSKMSNDELNMMEARKGIRYTPEQREDYQNLGGTPFLDRDYTVFGRVIEGLDVIDKIANVKTAPGDRPIDDVKMNIKVVE